MKIVVTANSAWYLFNFRSKFIEELVLRGHEVVCITSFDGYEKAFSGIGAKAINVPMKGAGVNVFSEIKSLWSLARQLRLENPDLVCSFTLKQNLYAGISSKILGISFLPNISGLGELFSDRKWFSTMIKKRLFCFVVGHSKHIFFQNEEDMKMMTGEADLIGNASCSRIPGSGVEIKRFQSSIRVPSENQIVFLMFSRFLPQKGFDVFLDAIGEFLAYSSENVEFQVMGRVDPDREESIELLTRLEAAASQGLIKLLPWSDQVEEILSRVDVVVLPTHYNEGVPRSLLEGLASGKMIIASDWKGVRDTVDHGRNGFLVNPHDPRSLLDAFQKVIGLSEEMKHAFSLASVNKAKSEFDEKIVFDAYLQIIT